MIIQLLVGKQSEENPVVKLLAFKTSIFLNKGFDISKDKSGDSHSMRVLYK